MDRLRMDDFTKYKFLSALKHSPDGKHAAFVVHQSDYEDNKYLSNLWLLDTESEKYFQLTSFDSERSFLWLDNENIIFPDIRSKKDKEKLEAGEEFTKYYKINIHGGEALEYFTIPRAVGAIKQVDEDTFIFTSTFDLAAKDASLLNEEEKKEYEKEKKEAKDYEVLEEIPYWSNGGGFTNKKRSRLYLYNISTGKVESLTEGYEDVYLFSLNDSKTRAVIITDEFKDKAKLTNKIAIYNIKERKFESLEGMSLDGEAYPLLSHSYATFIEEEKVIFSATAMKYYGINENDIWYVLDLKTLEARCITPDLDLSTWNSVGSDVRYGGSDTRDVLEGYLYFTTTEGCSSYLNRLDIEGNIEKVLSEEGSVDGISINKKGLLFIALRGDKLQEIYKLVDGVEKQITDFNGWVNREKSIVTPEKLKVETAPGVFIDGFLMKPVDFDENKKYPAILNIHGGPKTVYGSVFYHEMQYWANEGYVVFFCNPRGGDGRGNEFADIRGRYGTIDYEDLMAFTDYIIDNYSFIDRDKVGVTGGSYGGFMTNWIIGHTDRFKAAVSQRSISNWISMFCTTDIGFYFADDQNAGATPWNNPEKLWEHSPLKYAHKAKTPTLFIHSEQDYRCWLTEGLQMFTALKYNGVEARLCMFREENHELSRSGKPKHRVRRLREITNWFDGHLK